MGQNLSEPKTEKETSQYESERFVVGTSSMQGWRVGILLCHQALPTGQCQWFSSSGVWVDGGGGAGNVVITDTYTWWCKPVVLIVQSSARN